MKHASLFFKQTLPLAFAITALSGVLYVVTQQTIRQAANDPQIQIAEDTAEALQNGTPLSTFMPVHTINMEKSLSPFVIIFDAAGKPIGTAGYLDNTIPVPPAGVFDHARVLGENHITWQPKPGVRIAAVVKIFNGKINGFVLAGRSLREIEKREHDLFVLVFLGWLCALGATLLLQWMSQIKKHHS